MKTLLIDNYDSFTYNLYQLLAEVNGEAPRVIRNDDLDWEALRLIPADNYVISPGPGRPDVTADFGVCKDVLLHADRPVFGICLGHQGLGLAHGAVVGHAPQVMHGRMSPIHHGGKGLFQGLPSPFTAVRYHSLIVEQIPDCLELTAWTADGLIMGLRHRGRPLYGVQFHPESICTEHGRALLQNFREITRQFSRPASPARGQTCPARPSRGREMSGRGPDLSLAKAAPEPGSVLTPVAARTHTSLPQDPSPFGSGYQVRVRRLEMVPDAEAVFVHLYGDSPTAYWLDSSRVDEGSSRFSFMGDSSGPHALSAQYSTEPGRLKVRQGSTVWCVKTSIFDFLQCELERRQCENAELPFDFNTGFVGYFGYELKAECGSTLTHPSSLPDAAFLFADRGVVFDHAEQCCYLVCFGRRDEEREAAAWFDETAARLRALPFLPAVESSRRNGGAEFRLARSRRGYLDDIRYCLHQIVEGESYEVCLTNRVLSDTRVDPLRLYRVLRKLNPAPYAAFLRFDGFAIACSSPERFLRIDRDGVAESKPIKGTRRRGLTPAEDDDLREDLRGSGKDRAENLMITDLVRNDLGRVCEIGSVHVSKLMDVETYATVHQMVSTIRGRLAPGTSTIDAVRALFPGGSMTGAPKLRTMEIIDRLEQGPRGVYSGALGYLAVNGCADLNIVIRTAVVEPDRLSIGMGGAIVGLSNPDEEFEETMVKARRVMDAVAVAVDGEHPVEQACPQSVKPTVADLATSTSDETG